MNFNKATLYTFSLLILSVSGVCANQNLKIENIKDYQFFSRIYFSALNKVNEVKGNFKRESHRLKYWKAKLGLLEKLKGTNAMSQNEFGQAIGKVVQHSYSKRIYGYEKNVAASELAIAKARMENTTTEGFSGNLAEFIMNENKIIDNNLCQISYLWLVEKKLKFTNNQKQLSKMKKLYKQKAAPFIRCKSSAI